MSIALGGNVSLSLTPSGGNFTGPAHRRRCRPRACWPIELCSGNHTLTVTSTDVVGYKLYAYSPSSTTMVNGSDTIPASGNVTAAALSVNTWGYNTDGSSNFLGMTTTPTLIKDTVGPFKNGDNTTVTYGVLASNTKGAGAYTVSVVYTAVAESD